MRWDSKPDNRIRRTSSHPAPTRFEELLADARTALSRGAACGLRRYDAGLASVLKGQIRLILW